MIIIPPPGLMKPKGVAAVATASDWIFVDRIIVSTLTSKVIFGAGGDGELGTALDGDVDEVYLLETAWKVGNSNNLELEWRPNDSALGSDSETTILYGVGDSFEGAAEYQRLIAGRTHSGPNLVVGETVIHAKAGNVYGVGNYAQHGGATDHPWLVAEISSVWAGTDPITSIALLSSVNGTVSNLIQVPSRFRLFKRGLPS